MLLVIIALAFATIVATAYLSSRDNSALIGQNVSDAGKARWAASSGLDLSIAILQTDSNWRTVHTEGVLLQDYLLGDALIDVELTDLETGNAPNPETEYIQVVVTGEVNGIRKYGYIHGFAPVQDNEVDPDLSEFVIFTSGDMVLKDDAMIGRWQSAPLTELKRRVYLGTQETDALSIDAGATTIPIDTTVLNGPGASVNLVSNSSVMPIQQIELLDQIPFPNPQNHNVTLPPDAGSLPDPGAAFGTINTITLDQRYLSMNMGGGTIVFDGDQTIVVEGDFVGGFNSKVQVTGDTKLVVFGDLAATFTLIELADGASLKLFVRGNINFNHGFVGEQKTRLGILGHGPFDNTDTSSWMIPERVRLFGIDPATVAGPANPVWLFANNSVVKGHLYSPWARVEVDAASATYGSIAASEAELRADAGAYFSPTSNAMKGYTNQDSAIYDGAGNIEPVASGLGTLPDDGTKLTAAKAAIPPPPSPATDRPVVVTIFETDITDTFPTWTDNTDSGLSGVASVPVPLDNRLLNLAAAILDYPVGDFLDDGSRTGLANFAQETSLLVERADWLKASDRLNQLIQRADANASVADWMLVASSRDRVFALAMQYKAEIDAM